MEKSQILLIFPQKIIFLFVFNFRKLKTRHVQSRPKYCEVKYLRLSQQQVLVGLPAESNNVHFRLVDAIESLYFSNGMKKVINYKTALLFRRFFAHMWRDFLTRRQMEGIIHKYVIKMRIDRQHEDKFCLTIF